MAKRKIQNTKAIAKGDQFEVTTSFTMGDSGQAGLTDVTLTHIAEKNGEIFVDSSATWYGLDTVGVAAVKDALGHAGLVNGTVQLTGFQALVNEWRKVTTALGHLNDAGDKAVKDLNL